MNAFKQLKTCKVLEPLIKQTQINIEKIRPSKAPNQ